MLVYRHIGQFISRTYLVRATRLTAQEASVLTAHPRLITSRPTPIDRCLFVQVAVGTGQNFSLSSERFGHSSSIPEQQLTLMRTQHAADVFENGPQSTSFMYPHWRWREDKPRGNGLEEGPTGPRNIQHRQGA